MRRTLPEPGRHPANSALTCGRGLTRMLVTGGCLLSSTRAFTQGCAACYTTAASGGPETAHALRSGILVLLFPPVLIFGGIILAFRNWKRHQPHGRDTARLVSAREFDRS